MWDHWAPAIVCGPTKAHQGLFCKQIHFRENVISISADFWRSSNYSKKKKNQKKPHTTHHSWHLARMTLIWLSLAMPPLFLALAFLSSQLVPISSPVPGVTFPCPCPIASAAGAAEKSGSERWMGYSVPFTHPAGEYCTNFGRRPRNVWFMAWKKGNAILLNSSKDSWQDPGKGFKSILVASLNFFLYCSSLLSASTSKTWSVSGKVNSKLSC